MVKELSYVPVIRLHPRSQTVQPTPKRLALHMSEGIVLVSGNDIMYCIAESNYTHVFVSGGGHYILSKTLRDVEARLPNGIFFRTHQSHLVNLEAVTCITPQHVVMIDQKQLPIARAKRRILLEKLHQITLPL